MKPTYTKEEMLSMIKTSDLKELEIIRQLMKKEGKLYSIQNIQEIGEAYKARITALVNSDIPLLTRLFLILGFKF